jgi:hypothetical protein
MINMYDRMYNIQDDISLKIYEMTKHEVRRILNEAILDLEDIYSHAVEDSIEFRLNYDS